jgi:hypothetical protein
MATAILWLVAHQSKGRYAKKYLNMMVEKLFFSEFIDICLGGYMELLISGYLEFSYPLTTNPSEVQALIVGLVSLAITMFVLPSMLIWVVIQDKETI